MFKDLSGSAGGDCVIMNTRENQDVDVPTWESMEKMLTWESAEKRKQQTHTTSIPL
jgi:hypothetical protein